jgi:hypothetical protein
MCYPILTAIALQLGAISSLETTLSSIHLDGFAGRHSRLSRHHRVKPGLPVRRLTASTRCLSMSRERRATGGNLRRAAPLWHSRSRSYR